MRRFHIKSILLGIGIGIILTAIIGLIYSMGELPPELSKAVIIEKAKQYGMVEKSILIEELSPTPTILSKK